MRRAVGVGCVLLFVSMHVASAAVWIEGEQYSRQTGAEDRDFKAAAGNGQVLGFGWGKKAGQRAEYVFRLETAIPAARVHIRYARQAAEPARLRVTVDRGDPMDVSLAPTSGWGDRAEEFAWVATPAVGTLAAGLHSIRIEAAADGSAVSLDGFAVADASESMPADVNALARWGESSGKAVLFRECELMKRRVNGDTDASEVASAGQMVGSNWGQRASDSLEYDFKVPVDLNACVLFVRYARPDDGKAVGVPSLQVTWDETILPQVLPLPATGGWGAAPADFGWTSVLLGTVTAGPHNLKLTVSEPDTTTSMDCLFLAEAGFRPPMNTQAIYDAGWPLLEWMPSPDYGFLQTLEEPKVAAVDFAFLDALLHRDGVTESARKVVQALARRSNPTLLKAYDTPRATNYDADFVWQDVRKEKAYNPAGRDRIGVYNPNTALAFLVDLWVDNKPMPSDAPVECVLHTMDLLCYRVRHPADIVVEVWFIPVTSQSLQTVVCIANQDTNAHDIQIQPLARRDHYRDPKFDAFGRTATMSAGGKAWAEPTFNFSLGMHCLAECAPGSPPRQVGWILATQYMPGLLGESRPNISVTPDYYETDIGRRIRVAQGTSQAAAIGWSMLRFNEVTPYTSPRGTRFCPQSKVSRAGAASVALAAEAAGNDWQASVNASLRRYAAFPVATLPDETWSVNYLACLELPLAETYGPWGAMKGPFYNFTRAFVQNPFEWWSYGMHGHESLSTLYLDAVAPRLSADFVRGHFAVAGRDGGLPYGTSPYSVPEEKTTRATAPLVAWEAWQAYLWHGDRARIEAVYEPARRQHDWWLKTRDRTNDGLCHWLDWHETVRDQEGMPTWALSGGAEYQEALDLNCYLLMQERALAAMARTLGRADDAKRWDDAIAKRVQRMNAYMWNAGDSVYYGVNEVVDQWIDVLDISTFMPLWAGLAPADRAASIVSRLDGPDFATAFPPPVLGAKQPRFNPEGHWHGANWPQMTQLVIEGLRRYGYYERAATLAQRNAAKQFESLAATGRYHECFDSQTAAPVGLVDYIWSGFAAGYITDAIFGVEPREAGLAILPALPDGWNDIRLDNLHVRQSVVSLHVRRAPDAKATRALVNGKEAPVARGRGVLIPWEMLPAEATIEIVQPPKIEETYAPPWPLPALEAQPPHARPTDKTLVEQARKAMRTRKDLEATP